MQNLRREAAAAGITGQFMRVMARVGAEGGGDTCDGLLAFLGDLMQLIGGEEDAEKDL